MAKIQLTEYILENQQKFYRIAYCYVKEDTVTLCMEQLPENIRIILQLRYYEELSLKEITDTNLSTVKTRLYNGLGRKENNGTKSGGSRFKKRRSHRKQPGSGKNGSGRKCRN